MTYDPFAHHPDHDEQAGAPASSHYLEDGSHPSGSQYHEAAVLLVASVDALVDATEDLDGNEDREAWLHDEIDRTDPHARWAALECLLGTLVSWCQQAGHPVSFGALVEHHPLGVPDELADACHVIVDGFIPRLAEDGTLPDPPIPLVGRFDDEDSIYRVAGLSDPADLADAVAEERAWFAAGLHVFWGLLALVGCGSGASFPEVADALPSFGEHPDLPGTLGEQTRADWLDDVTQETMAWRGDLTAAVTLAFDGDATDPDAEVPFEAFDLTALEDAPHPDAVELFAATLTTEQTYGGAVAETSFDDGTPVMVIERYWTFEHQGRAGFAAAAFAYPLVDGVPEHALTGYDTVLFAADGPMFPTVFVCSGVVARATDPVRQAVAAVMQDAKRTIPLQSLWSLLNQNADGPTDAEGPPSGSEDDEDGGPEEEVRGDGTTAE